MRKLFIVATLLCTFALLAPSAFAVDGSEVRLRSSTVPGAKPESIGFFDITSPDKLAFAAPGSAIIAIPYGGITDFASSAELAHHFGVGGTILVGILKKRQRVHYLTITYREGAVTQVASFEVSKDAVDVLASLLRAKAPSAIEHNNVESVIHH